MTAPGLPYTSDYFEGHLEGSLRSARAVLPIVLELVQIKSAVDVGCGVGAWVSVLMELGVEDVVGIDGAYVDRTRLLFPSERFVAHDLTTDISLDRRFDLAMSLEVAEHLPPERAEAFIMMLTGLAPRILFSAAIPGQGGISHTNEQWPEYWVRLFDHHGFAPVDAVRHRIWSDATIEPYYAQNILLFASADVLDESPGLRRESERQDRPLDVVHPRIFEIRKAPLDPPTTLELLGQLPRAVFRSLGLAGTRTRVANELRRLRQGSADSR